MVVLVTGHQVRCILWKQMAIFNKGIDILCGLKLFYKATVKNMQINNYELLNIHTCSFIARTDRVSQPSEGRAGLDIVGTG